MNQSSQLISPSLQRTNLPHKEANDGTLIRTTLRQSTTAHPTTWSLTVIRQTSLAYTVRCHGLKQGTGKILQIRWTDTSGKSGYSTNRTNPLFERWESNMMLDKTVMFLSNASDRRSQIEILRHIYLLLCSSCLEPGSSGDDWSAWQKAEHFVTSRPHQPTGSPELTVLVGIVSPVTHELYVCIRQTGH